MGIDQIKIFENVIKEVAATEEMTVDVGYVRLCLQAHTHNPVTAYYYLLLKKKIIQGEPIDDDEQEENLANQAIMMPQERQTKRYQSIEPVRTTLYNEKNKYQLRKIAEGLNDFNVVRINTSNMATTPAANPTIPIMSPQTVPKNN